MAEVKFTPLCSSRNDQCYCFLLSIGEDNILLDCGWTPEFCLADVEGIEKVVKDGIQVCAVLLSQPDIAHMGALPYVYGKLGLRAPIYCPLPLRNEGIYLLANELISKTQREPFTLFDEKDIRATMDHFFSADYGKKSAIASSNDLSITVHKAGGKIGGSVWVITNKMESIAYTVSYNDRAEILLDPFDPRPLANPWMLITDISNTNVAVEKRRARDSMLQDAVSATLLRGGNVLIPVNTSSRWLELALILRSVKNPPPLYLLSYASEQAASYKYIEYLRQSGHITSSNNLSDAYRGGEQLKLLDSASVMRVKSLSEIRDKAACVLASGPDLSSGFSKDLFLKWLSSPSNTIIFTDKSTKRSLTREILRALSEKKKILKIPNWVPHKKSDLRTRSSDSVNGDAISGSAGGNDDDMVLDDPDGDDVMDDVTGSACSGPSSSSSAIHSSSSRAHNRNSHESGFKRYGDGVNPLLTEFDATPESFRMTGMQFAMFPSDEDFDSARRREDRKAKGLDPTPVPMAIDDYGVVIDPAEYIVKEEALYDSMIVESPLFKELNAIFQSSKEGLVFEKEERVVSLECNVCFIDYEGRAGDPRETIKTINPLNLILVNGDEEAIKEVTDDLKKESGIGSIHAPEKGESVVIKSNMYMHKISVKESTCPTVFPTFVDMMASSKDEFTVMEKERPWHDTVMLTGQKRGRKEIFEFLRMNKYPVYYDDNDNYAIVYNSSNGSFVIRVPEDNIADISFEGPLCDEYYALKDLIYENYKIV